MDAFDKYDLDGNGKLTREELPPLLENLHINMCSLLESRRGLHCHWSRRVMRPTETCSLSLSLLKRIIYYYILYYMITLARQKLRFLMSVTLLLRTLSP